MGTFLAQTSGSAAADTSAYAEINDITTCKKKEEAPAKAPEPAKKQEDEIKKKEAANDTASSSANSSNGTNSSKSSGKKDTTEATPAATPAKPAAAGAGNGAGSGENNELTPEDEQLKTIQRLKAKQNAKQGTDKIGDKQAKNADEVTKNNKDMAAGPENEFKDQTPSNVQKNQTASSAQKQTTANAQVKENGQLQSSQKVKAIQNDVPKLSNQTAPKSLAKISQSKSAWSQFENESKKLELSDLQN